jgi:hypothetical protein
MNTASMVCWALIGIVLAVSGLGLLTWQWWAVMALIGANEVAVVLSVHEHIRLILTQHNSKE